jgi:hypothetical protein
MNGLNDIKAGDVMRDHRGDLWRVVGEHYGRIVCIDEPNDDPEMPYISIWTWEDFSRMTLV